MRFPYFPRFLLPAALAVLVALGGGAVSTTPAQAQETTSKLFIVVTSAEPQVQGMAMILGLQARSHGSAVRLLLCGAGGDMALKDSQQAPLKPMDKTPQELLQKLVSQGATAEVCGLYLPNSGHGPEALIDGVEPVKPPVIGTYMADPAVRYFTF
jgi:predicted peroxiredoxin